MLYLDKLQGFWDSQPEKIALRWLNEKFDETSTITYKQLDEMTAKLACCLRSPDGFNISEGSRVLLVYPPSLDFIVAFIACLRASIVAVPVFPPDPRQLKKNLYLFSAVQKSSGAEVALTNTEYNWVKKLSGLKNIFKKDGTVWPDVKWIETNKNLPNVEFKVSKLRVPEPLDLAFLQYTSGSTSDPKGVMICHSNLSHNISTIVRALKADVDTVVVSWLPQYHDMGLIGSYLSLLYCGGTGVYLSPLAFIKNPVLWLKAVSQYRGTHLQAPNFAYILTSRKFQSYISSGNHTLPSDFDLSCVKHMFNAAEPVTAEACDTFAETLSPYGFDGKCIVPGYGLAEHVVYVCDGGTGRLVVDKEVLESSNIVKEISVDTSKDTTGNKDDIIMSPHGSSLLVGCGFPSRNVDIDVHIVNTESFEALEEDQVGEIWINGPSKAKGYYGLEEVNQEVFHAKISKFNNNSDSNSNNNKDDGYLRTGDLGFLHKGELYVCGRIKDLIIIRGRNHYPQDIERSVESDARLRPGCSAVFSSNVNKNSNESEAEESLVVVAEVRDVTSGGTVDENTLSEISDRIRLTVSSEHGVQPAAIVLLKPRTIFKTSSGKIARQRNRRNYENELFQPIYIWNNNNNNNNNNSTIGATNVTKALNEVGDDISPVTSPPLTHRYTWSGPDELKEILRDIVVKYLGDAASRSDVDLTVPLLDVGMDSLALAQFRGQLEMEFNFTMSEEDMFDEDTTLITLVNHIIAHSSDSAPLVGGGTMTAISREVAPVRENTHRNTTEEDQNQTSNNNNNNNINNSMKHKCCRIM